jgi:ABC-type transporter Mla maintaining outer membrane lipid asymmetry permease subunit MlaE
VGRKTLTFLEDVGGLAILVKDIFLALPKAFSRFHLTTEQMLVMGVNSLPLVALVSIFTGAVTAVQAVYQISDYVPMMAGLVMLPVLTIFSDAVALAGGLGISATALHVPPHVFISGFKSFFKTMDLASGLSKALVFGCIISIIGCYQGFRTKGGAEGVGRSATKAVVLASVLILIADYVVASILFG